MAFEQNRLQATAQASGLDASQGLAGAARRNRVLRNTYWLLALSMVPTVLGAWIGVQSGFSFFAGSPFVGLLVFLGVAFGFFFAIERFKNSGVGVALLLGFTFFMGLMLSRLVGAVLGFSNGASLVMTAFGGTAAIFAVMAGVASVSKRDFTGMGKWLFIGFMVVFVAAIANIWLQMPALALTVSTLAVLIFSAFILYDLQRVVNGGETNYVTATLSVYLSIYNVFANLLMLLGVLGGERD
ncbi:MAG: Bax inhibitor-1/YccA family protein [Burkholderiaceae bacterium]|nr:Bax inhibitor-1/YccA family protein [Burkholderiaceae bacterium]